MSSIREPTLASSIEARLHAEYHPRFQDGADCPLTMYGSRVFSNSGVAGSVNEELIGLGIGENVPATASISSHVMPGLRTPQAFILSFNKYGGVVGGRNDGSGSPSAYVRVESLQ